MAKEYRRSSASSGRTFGAKKTRSAKPEKRDEERSERKSGERKPFVKKTKKREDEPSFKRYRDQGKPSDFGSGKRSSYSNDNDASGNDRPFNKRSGSKDRSFNKDRSGDRGKPSRSKSFSDENEFSGQDQPFNKRSGSRDRRSFNDDRFDDKPEKSGRSKSGSRDDDSSGEDRSFNKRSGFKDRRSSNDDRFDDKPEKSGRSKSGSGDDNFSGEDRSFNKRSGSRDRRTSNDDRSGDKPEKSGRSKSGSRDDDFSREGRSFNKRSGQDSSFKSFRDKSFSPKKKKEVNPYDLDESDFEFAEDDGFDDAPIKKRGDKKSDPDKRKAPASAGSKKEDGLIRLNKYISNAGICSRREADELIASGVVQVNGKTITEMGYKVKPSDVIKYGGQTLKKERMVYLILNKPKDYITTVDDPQKRRTVLELVHDACKERIYPVGRLDRSTTGLLMFTNDGELTKKLTHPKYGVRKIYHVELDKPLKKQDFDQIMEGLELEDGLIKVDEISYVADGKDKSQIGIELHSGKNRIVRRIFEHLGYNVRKLDRVMFGPLTKKDLPRGRWRFLTQAEVGIMNMISSD